ncbi:MAG: hypothetical protein K0R65_336 [Crocinitomicaceae bacterium]|jgi:hypothetical protein|nr:hypothetical protein [Crocinitomicaceae bacterium]
MEEEKAPLLKDQETAFSSPLPALNKLRSFIFGDEKPEMMLRIPIYINILIWFIFLMWHILSYYAISYRDVILEEKKVNVEILILNRGNELGFDPSVFLGHLIRFHAISILCWAVVFIGIVLMWRKKKNFLYFLFGPLVIYLGTLLFYMGMDYYLDDTTFFDKLLFFLLVLNSIFYLIIFRRQEENPDSNFFETD